MYVYPIKGFSWYIIDYIHLGKRGKSIYLIICELLSYIVIKMCLSQWINRNLCLEQIKSIQGYVLIMEYI